MPSAGISFGSKGRSFLKGEGAIHFTNEGLSVSDKSGVIIQMATSFNSYKDHRFLEKIGIAPNIRTEAGKDALADAITDYFAHRASN